MSKIRRVFLNVSMVNRIDGLNKIALSNGIKTASMEVDDYLIFVNSERNKIAMLVGPHRADKPGIMAYVKLESGRRADLRVIAEIPRAFDGKKINYDEALTLAVEKALASKREGLYVV